MPVVASRSSRSGPGVMSSRPCSGAKIAAGCGSKVTATAGTPRALPSATSRPRTAWCPRWTPSKLPKVATLGRSEPGVWEGSVQRCTEDTLRTRRGEHDVRPRFGAGLVEHGHQGAVRGEGRHRLGTPRLGRVEALAVADGAGLLLRELAHRELGAGGLREGRHGYGLGPLQGAERLQRVGPVEVEGAHAGAPQGGEVSTDPERSAQVTGEGPHVG